MSDRLEQVRQIVREFVELMRRHNALISLDPHSHTAQVVFLPEQIVQKSLDSLQGRYMYNILMQGEVGFSPILQEELGLDEAVTQIPEEQIEPIKKFMEYIQYFTTDEGNDWLKDLGMDSEEKEEGND